MILIERALCMISSLHVTRVMMVILMMPQTQRQDILHLLSSQRAAEPCKAVVHPSDTCHDQLFACDQGDDGDWDDA